MQLIRWNDDPFASIGSLHSQIDDMFNRYFSAPVHSGLGTMPTMDVYTEEDKQLVAEINAPGFSKDDIEVSVDNGILEVRGEKHEKDEEKNKKRNYMVRESHASFYRRIALPKHADGDKVTAHFENGVLKVVVPFSELPKPKRVAISHGKAEDKK